MKKLIYPALLMMAAGAMFAQNAKDFVGTWKSDPGGPTMTRKLELENGVIVMTEIQPGRDGGPERTIVRKYPTDGSEVKMDSGVFAGATATGKMEGNVLTVDTTMTNGTKFHDVWTLSEDGKHYTNEMVISGAPNRGGAGGGGDAKGGERKGGRRGPIKFSFTKE